MVLRSRVAWCGVLVFLASATAADARIQPPDAVTSADRTKVRLARLGPTPASVQAGSSFRIRGRVRGVPRQWTEGARLHVGLRRSRTARRGIHLTTFHVKPRAGARSRRFSLRISVPASVRPGLYLLRVRVRRSGGDERASTKWRRMRITRRGTPQPSPAPSEARHSLRAPVTGENFYFVMADRFQNGSTANDTGDIEGDYHQHGFEPTKKGYYHGGDLKGLLDEIPYIQGMGTTAIWLTPSFKNRAVQGTGANESAGYHGYWVTDFTQIDPHLGTNDDLRRVVEAAHARGMKVFFDIITNHTADVILHEENNYAYVPKDVEPYRTAAGTPFDDRDYAGTSTFPPLNAQTSFPYTPKFASPADASVKQPAWLNDPIYYHMRGDTSFVGENSLYGDFFGLDDLFTEHPRVVSGMVDIYKAWIRDFRIDGFRIDTMKHVNDEFWQTFAPEVLSHARGVGKSEFFMFGEVFDSFSKPFTSHFTTYDKVQSVLDFPFQEAARDFASRSRATNGLRDFFTGDDWYTDADSNVYQLPTFLGNHDMGHIGMFLRDDNPAGTPESELLDRDVLAHELMYLSRGNPVVYFGDEQGFTGAGNGQAARQDMFPSADLEYDNQGDDAGKNDNIGSDETPIDDNFDRDHPLYRKIAELAALAKAHPALRNGAQQHRHSSDGQGIYAFSRLARTQQREYVVALNNAESERTASVPTYVARGRFEKVYGPGPATLTSDGDRELGITLPALSTTVYRSAGPIPRSGAAPSVAVYEPAHNAGGRDRMEVRADVGGDSFYEVTFLARAGNGRWSPIGTDDNAPYRVFHDIAKLAPGTQLQYRAVVLDNAGHERGSNVRAAKVAKPSIALELPAAGSNVRGTVEVRAGTVPELSHYRVTFQRRIGSGGWENRGTDDSSPVYTAYDQLPDGLVEGTPITYRAILDYGAGTVTSAERTVQAAAPPVTEAFIYYNGSAADWGLHLFGDGLEPGEATAEWTAPTPFEGTDGGWVFHRIRIADDTKRVGFIIHRRPPGDPNVKDGTEADRFFTPADNAKIWIKQGDATIYTSPPP